MNSLARNVFENLPQNVWWVCDIFKPHPDIRNCFSGILKQQSHHCRSFLLPTNDLFFILPVLFLISQLDSVSLSGQPIENFFSVHWMQSCTGKTVRLFHEQTKRSNAFPCTDRPFASKLLDDFTTDKPFRFPESMADDWENPLFIWKIIYSPS